MNLITWFKNHLENRKVIKNEIFEIKNLVKSHPHFFKNGLYKFKFNVKRVYYIDNKTTIDFINSLKIHLNYKSLGLKLTPIKLASKFIKLLIYRDLYFKKIKISSALENEYECDLIMALHTNSGFKAFSFSQNKVIRFFNSNETFEKTLDSIEASPNELNTAIVKIDNQNKVIFEDLLVPKLLDEISFAKIEKIFEEYHKDLTEFILQIPVQNISEIQLDDFFKFIDSEIFNLETKSFTNSKIDRNKIVSSQSQIHLINFKNDLAFKNFIIHENGYAIIDFEDTSLASILHLFLAYKKDLSLNYDANHMLRKYKNGDFDSTLIKVFNKLNITYNIELRLEYFYLSLLPYNLYLKHKKSPNEVISDKTKDLINTEIKTHLENYLSL